MKKPSEFNVEREIRGAIRRVFVRSPIIREVLLAVRREVPKFNTDGAQSKKNSVQYQCAVCSEWTKSTEVSVDHIHPVVSVEDGFIDFNTFVARLFCSKENLQVICEKCHDKKTYKERIDRLTKQYEGELSQLSLELVTAAELTPEVIKEFQKKLTRLISTKATDELKPVAARATELMNDLKKRVRAAEVCRLTGQYTKELDIIWPTVRDGPTWPAGIKKEYHKELLGRLTKVISAAKKLEELKPVLERAEMLKTALKRIKPAKA